MKKIVILLAILIALYICIYKRVLAENKVLINEFLIDPQPQAVEIINTSSEEADISNWVIDDNGGSAATFVIPQSTIIYPNSCLVFSRDFYLNKSSSDSVRLFDNGMNLIDSFPYKSSSGSGVSYLRLPDGENWTTASASLGFFNKSGISCIVSPTVNPTAIPTQFPTQAITPSISPTEILEEKISYENIYISEVMANPNPGEKEWVEIYNDNDFTAYLRNWYIDDAENFGSSPKSFSLEIPSHGYKVFSLNSSMFNNDGDEVRLMDFDKNIKDGFEYNDTAVGKTLGRNSFSDDSFCDQDPSYEKINNPCLDPTPTKVLSQISNVTPSIRLSPNLGKNLLQKNNSYAPKLTNQVVIENKQPQDVPQVLGLEMEPSSRIKTSGPVFLSLSYSLLTMASILFKMTFIYGKGKKVLQSFIDPGRNK